MVGCGNTKVTDISRVYFDIDNVIRDFAKGVFGYHPLEWVSGIGGVSVEDYVSSHLDLLLKCPVTDFGISLWNYAVSTSCSLRFLSRQRDSWRAYTTKWLSAVFIGIPWEVSYVHEDIDKLAYLFGFTDKFWLLDDSPVFGGVPEVILLDKTYNRGKDCRHNNRVLDFTDFMSKGF